MARILRAIALLVAGLGAVAPVTPVTAQTLYTITDLGALPGAPSCMAFAVNDRGVVAGTCSGADPFNEMAFVWDSGVMTALGTLPRANYSAAHAINAAGVVVGEGDSADFRPEPTLYRDGTVVNIDENSGNARAIYVNDAGVIVGNYAKGFGPVSSWSPVIWTERADRPGRFDRISLEPYPGGESKSRYGYAVGANQQLQVVGYVQNSLFGQRGAFWDNDADHTLTLLEPLPGDWSSVALAVNDLGQAVGQSHHAFRTRAVLWMNDAARTPVDLGTLPGDLDSTATAINNQGQVIGLSTSAENVTRPFLWENGQMLDVNTLLDATGGGADWTILSVTGINNLGQIVGIGQYQGQPRSFLMTPAGR
jgi:probable HAF family extracellular repeat protein